MFSEIITKIKDFVKNIKNLIGNLDNRQKKFVLIGLILLLVIFLYSLEVIFRTNPIDSVKVPQYNIVTTYKGAGKEALLRPLGVAVAPNGDVYVADSSHHRIEVFSVEGKIVRIFGEPGVKDGQLNYPTSLALFEDRLYIADSGNKRISVFSTDGQFIRKIDSIKIDKDQDEVKSEEDKDNSSQKPESFQRQSANIVSDFKPLAVAIDSKENIYVADGQEQRILVFNSQGALKEIFGGLGAEKGKMRYPNGIALDEKGKRIFVSDFYNERIQVFSFSGKFQYEITGEDVFANPRGIAYDPVNNLIYVANIFGHQIAILTDKGDLIRTYGEYGNTKNELNFPNGLFLYKNLLYIADRENQRIVVLKVSM